MKVAERLEWGFAATLHYCAKYPLGGFHISRIKKAAFAADMEANSE